MAGMGVFIVEKSVQRTTKLLQVKKKINTIIIKGESVCFFSSQTVATAVQ